MVRLLHVGWIYLFRHSQYRRDRRRMRYPADYQKWLEAGRPVPPPHIVKQKAVKETASAHGLRVFVETGTYRGEMIDAVLDAFDRIYSIEIAHPYWHEAQRRYAKHTHVQIRLGDSTDVLPSVLNELRDPCLFWLDGHYSGGRTAKGNVDTPILSELHHIFRHPLKNHAVLIDDARCFTGKSDYPSLDQLRRLVSANAPDTTFLVRDDIIRLLPGKACRQPPLDPPGSTSAPGMRHEPP